MQGFYVCVTMQDATGILYGPFSTAESATRFMDTLDDNPTVVAYQRIDKFMPAPY